MDANALHYYLDHPEAAADWLRRLRFHDPAQAHGNLLRMSAAGIPVDLLAEMCRQAAPVLAACGDPDRVFNGLEQYVAASRSRLALGAYFQRDPTALPILLQILAASQHFVNVLVTDPEAFDLLRITGGMPVARETLVREIVAEVGALDHDAAVLRALRRFKHRETLRIAYGDIVREQSLAAVTRQISFLADAVVEAAVRAAWRKVSQLRGVPRDIHGQTARFVVLAMGKLGGEELNYSSDIDLIFFYDGEGKTEGHRSLSNPEFFDRMAREVLRFLSEKTELGFPYRVDMRLRPDGERGPFVPSIASAIGYYENRGRTWERQAYIKARPIAGDLALGRAFLEWLQPWIYRRYLSRADISGIKALKRRIEQGAKRHDGDARNVKTGHGGIRDIEFAIQFLQLLNGGDLPQLRTGNTMDAIVKLEQVGCLTNLERTILEDSYSFLRRIEHRLQIMFDLQTHLLPHDREELRKLAVRLGYSDTEERTGLEMFLADFRTRTDLNRKILDHLLNDAFGDDQAAEEVDLVLDPDPAETRIVEVLGKYPFRDVKQAFRNLMGLAEEKIRFLSTRRCRHFLAAIAPQLLAALAKVPDPDSALVNLGRVADSLGGKGVLWELFSFNPPSLRVFVDLCAYSPFLSDMLTSNPGMIDSLMDSLVLDKLPTRPWMRQVLADLCSGAEDLDPILHSFKNDQQLRVGVRDILGKENVQATTAALSDIAEVCLEEIAAREYESLVERYGHPTIGEGPRAGHRCERAILGLGKFGGREMSYHSDLDIIFFYEADGHTAPEPGSRAAATSNQHFFSEWGQRIIKTAGRSTGYGKLYEIDARLRPTGKSGTLATSLTEFARYYAERGAQLWERQALCRARVACAAPEAIAQFQAAIDRAAFDHTWRPGDTQDIRQMRRRLEQTAGAADLKRGVGGIVDVEFLVQLLQLKYGRTVREIRSPNTLAALAALRVAGRLDESDFQTLDAGYRFLRAIESRLRLMNSIARDNLPDDPGECDKLARWLNFAGVESLRADFAAHTHSIRECFDRVLSAEEKNE